MKKRSIIVGIASLMCALLIGVLAVKNTTKAEAAWYFKRVNIEKCSVYLDKDVYEKTGAQIKPEVTVIYQGEKLVRDVDYTLTYASNIEAGWGKVKLKGIGDFRGNKTAKFKIVGIDISNLEPYIESNLYRWTGKQIKPKVHMSYQGVELTEGIDYTVYYYDNISPGVAKIRIYGEGKFSGSVAIKFSIEGISMKYDCHVEKDKHGQLFVYHGDEVVSHKNYDREGPFVTQKLIKVEGNKKTYRETTTYTFTGKGEYYGTLEYKEVTKVVVIDKNE